MNMNSCSIFDYWVQYHEFRILNSSLVSDFSVMNSYTWIHIYEFMYIIHIHEFIFMNSCIWIQSLYIWIHIFMIQNLCIWIHIHEFIYSWIDIFISFHHNSIWIKETQAVKLCEFKWSFRIWIHRNSYDHWSFHICIHMVHIFIYELGSSKVPDDFIWNEGQGSRRLCLESCTRWISLLVGVYTGV